MKAHARAMRLQSSEPGSKREKTQTKRSNQLNRLVHSGANMARKNEEVEVNLNTDESQEINVMAENDQRMAMYSRALGIMGAHYAAPIVEKKQDKKDKEDESLGEKDGKESTKKQSEKDRRDESEGEKKSEKKKGKFWQDSDGDGKWYEKGEDVKEGMMPGGGDDKKEMIKAVIKKKMAEKKAGGMAECIDAEMVMNYLIAEDYVDNMVSAEVMFNHMSDEFLIALEEEMMSEFLVD